MADLIEESRSSSDRSFTNRTINVSSIIEQFTGAAVDLEDAMTSNTECRRISQEGVEGYGHGSPLNKDNLLNRYNLFAMFFASDRAKFVWGCGKSPILEHGDAQLENRKQQPESAGKD